MFLLQSTKTVHRHGLRRAAICRLQRACARPTISKSQLVEIGALLKEPTWSVRETLFATDNTKDTTPISKEQLHHLLRLSALPLPKSTKEETELIEDLTAHLRFVQAIQRVNTDGVEPLQIIRDETEDARKRNTITLDSLKEEFAKEIVVGRRRRIRRVKMEKDPTTGVKAEMWNPLSHARRSQGPYFIVDAAQDWNTS